MKGDQIDIGSPVIIIIAGKAADHQGQRQQNQRQAEGGMLKYTDENQGVDTDFRPKKTILS